MTQEKAIPSCSPPEGERALPLQSRGGYKRSHISYARVLRKALTPWEQILWYRLRKGQLGYKFRRQQPVGPYVVDFINHEKKLVIEVDGSQHTDNAADAVRDYYLSSKGFIVLRFWNSEIDTQLEGVLERILQWLRQSPHRLSVASPTPPQGGSKKGSAA